MKKKLAIFSILAVATMAICSCGSKKDSTEEATTAKATEATTEASTTEATTEAVTTEAASTSDAGEIPALVKATGSDAVATMELFYNDKDEVLGRTDYVYDNKHNLVEIITYCRDAIEPYRHTVYAYDEAGNCINEKAFREAAPEEIEYEYVSEYDENGNIIKRTNNSVTATLPTVNTYEYNDQNQLVKMTVSDSVTPVINYTVYEYTEDGQIASESNYEADDTLSLKNEYIYENGLLVKLNVSDGTKVYAYRAYEYDENNLMIKESVYFSNQLDHEEVYEYDEFGNKSVCKTVYKEDDYTSTYYSY